MNEKNATTPGLQGAGIEIEAQSVWFIKNQIMSGAGPVWTGPIQTLIFVSMIVRMLPASVVQKRIAREPK